jgi:hypothetical protein
MFKQVVFLSDGTQEFLVPPEPRYWRELGAATVIRYLGESPLPEEFLGYALASGWKYFPDLKSFYPTQEDTSVL